MIPWATGQFRRGFSAGLEKILSLLQGLPQSEMEFLVTITIYVLYTTEILKNL